MSEVTIMKRLKSETWPEHQQAEKQQLEQELVAGTLARYVYTEYLAQRYLIHVKLEEHLAAAASSEPRVAALFDDRRRHAPRAAEDIRYFGRDPVASTPLPATGRLLDSIARSAAGHPVSLLGFFYVFEGSTNGARYIARALRGAYHLEGNDGTRYLDPYGDEQRALWEQFKLTMDSQTFTAAEQDSIIEAARATFRHMIELDQEIYARAGG